MPSKRALRSAVAAQQEQLIALDEDYVGQYPAKRTKFNAGARERKSRTEVAKAPLNDRASRASRRAAEKRGNTEQPEGQVALNRQGRRQLMFEDKEGGSDDEEYQEEDGGVNHDLIAQAISRGLRGPRRTVNGIGTRQYEQSQHEGRDGEEEEEEQEPDDEGGLHMSRSSEEPRGRRPDTAPNGHDGASVPNRDDAEPETRANEGLNALYEFVPSPAKTRAQKRPAAGRGTKNKQTAPRQIIRSTTSQRREPAQNQESRDDFASSSENEGEPQGGTTVDVAEESAYIEAPPAHEKLTLVEVTINSMKGIFKTLGHQAWTRRADWKHSFETNNKSNGDPTACKTVLGKELMKSAMSLKRILENATDAWKTSEELDDDDIQISTEYLRGKSADIKKCFAGINQAVEGICTEALAPPPPAADEDSAKRAVQSRRRLLREISRRLVPMLVLVVDKTCGLALAEDRRSKLNIYFNTFTLQFFLRTLSWTTRLHNALSRSREQWPYEAEFMKDDTDLDENEQKAKQGKIEAWEIFREQLAKLHFAAKRAERAIQETAAKKVEKQRREANRRRAEEQARLAKAAKEREEEEKRQKDAALYAHCIKHSQGLNYMPDPEHERWLRDEAVRKRASQEAFAQNNAPGRVSDQIQGHRASGTGQAGTVQSRVGPFRYNRIEEDPNDSDPFAESPPPRNRVTPIIQDAYNRPRGSDLTRPLSQATRPWAYKEEKALVKSIRYHRTYNLASMAAKLGRSEDDVERKVFLLLQGYRAGYTERGQDIPVWLSDLETSLGISSLRSR
ncbi:hypothetical protein VMCG_03115 [Cytospora schulzeri]|uniref:Uncharacterized protein n=1 Tax=Cytospora schulzeri TaxID=448051 RepID=A0A423WXM6_9PEZI|nr:hypothetical protein VMCG_03115 [Valsa malicola]